MSFVKNVSPSSMVIVPFKRNNVLLVNTTFVGRLCNAQEKMHLNYIERKKKKTSQYALHVHIIYLIYVGVIFLKIGTQIIPFSSCSNIIWSFFLSNSALWITYVHMYLHQPWVINNGLSSIARYFVVPWVRVSCGIINFCFSNGIWKQ